MHMRMANLSQCAEVIPGFSTKGAISDNPDGTVQVITAQHLNKGETYRYRPEHRLKIVPPRLSEKYMLKPGDILFMSRGTNNYAVLLAELPHPSIAPLTFYILKPRAGVLPAYLAWCLNQEPVKALINSIRTGAATPLVPRDAFADIMIPLPAMNIQERVADLSHLQAREDALLRRLEEETERMHRLTGQRILSHLTGVI